MASFTEKQSYKIEVNEDLSIGVRRSDFILKDNIEVGRTYHRCVLMAGDDLSEQPKQVQDIAAIIWTNAG